MRRVDKEQTDLAALEAVLDAAEWGTLGLVSPEGRAVLVPVNFVRHQGLICFHGSQGGEKMELLKLSGDATFLVADALAQIPSYVSDAERACPATQLYRSVLLYGQVALVEDPERKAAILQALMVKLQPEGGHVPITAPDPRYQASLAGVAVLAMTVDRISGKFAVGQAFSEGRRAAVTALLESRGGPKDRETLEAMARFRPVR